MDRPLLPLCYGPSIVHASSDPGAATSPLCGKRGAYLDEDKGGVGAMQAHVASGGSAEDGEGSGEPPEQPVHALVLGRGDVNEPPPRGHAFWHVLETGRGQTHVLLDAS